MTIDRAIKSAGCPIEVIVVDNGFEGPKPAGRGVRVLRLPTQGSSTARHAGVMAASTGLIVTIDAHVYLGNGWAMNIVETFNADAWARTVACGNVGTMRPDTFAPDDNGKHYSGARINWLDTSAEPRHLVARWHDGTPGRQIGAVMGAFYAFRRHWYTHGMGRPWAVNLSWGCDEEIISIASYLSGGDCRLLPSDCTAWHRFATNAPEYTTAEKAEIINNRLRLLTVFPFSAREINAVMEFIGYPSGRVSMDGIAQGFAAFYADKRPELERYLHRWVTGYREWQEANPVNSLEEATTHAEPAPTPPPPLPPQHLAAHPVDVCVQCDAIDSFVVTKVYTTFRRYKCKKCGKTAWRLTGKPSEIKFSIRND